MAYQEVSVSAITDVPAAILAFATARGWAVSGSNLTIPGGEQFSITATISGTNNQDHQVFVTRVADSSKRAIARSPKFNGIVNAPVVPAPTKVHLIGGPDPEPFISAVIEYGFNSYRHLYIGMLEKLGSFTGGEVISATGANWHGFNVTVNWRENIRYHFQSSDPVFSTNDTGGVKVDHADNPVVWRYFDGAISNNNNTAIGGFGDQIVDAYVANGIATYAGAHVLTPCNLWLPVGTTDTYYAPIGRPAGVRLVRMDGIDPGASISDGVDTWRCFPAISKQEIVTAPRGTYYPAYETSLNIGYAYLES